MLEVRGHIFRNCESIDDVDCEGLVLAVLSIWFVMSEFSVPLQHSCARFKLGCRCASSACVSLDPHRSA